MNTLSTQQSDPDPEPQQPKRIGRTIAKIAVWLAVAVASLLAIAALAVAILLNNASFHRYLIATAEAQAGQALGVRVRLQNFALNLSALSLDLYGVTVDGAAPYPNPPLLQVDRAQVSVGVVSILKRKWYLNFLEIDRPIVRVYVDANGISNIPTFKSGNSKSNTTIFDLGIRRALLDRGEVYFNDRKSDLSADLHNVDFEARFNAPIEQYSGRLAYSGGHIISGSFQPIPHDLEAEFDATPSTFHLHRAKLSAGQSQLSVAATVQDYSNPIVDARYDALVDGGQIRRLLQSPSIPTGQIRLTGNVHYAQTAGQQPLMGLSVDGDLSSRRLVVVAPSLQAAVTNIAGRYSLSKGDATLKDFKVDLLGGELTANGTMSNLGGDSHSKLNASLRGVSLADLKRLAGNSASTRGVALAGALNAELSAAWGKSLDDLTAHADATIDGHVSAASNGCAPAIPVDGAIHGSYAASQKELTLAKSYLKTPKTSLTLDGVVGNRSSLAVRLQADDLQEVETMADLFRPAPPGQTIAPLGLAGTASFDGTVQGSTAAPHVTGQFVAANLQVHGSAWKMARVHVDASPSLVSLDEGDLESASHGRIAFDARAGLTKWAFSQTSPVTLDLNAAQLNVADLLKLAGQPLPVTGRLAAQVKLHGTELSPIGNGNVTLTGLVAYEQPVNAVKLTFAGTGEEAHADLSVQLPSGSLQGKASVLPQQRSYTAQLSAAGIDLSKLQALKARNLDVAGVVSLNAGGQGTFDDPQGEATLEIPQLTVQKQSAGGLKLQLNVANHLAYAALDATAMAAKIQAKARVELTGEYTADASLDTGTVSFAPILAVYAPGQAGSITGQTEIHATMHGPLKNMKLMQAQVTIPTLKASYGGTFSLAEATPIRAEYRGGVVQLQHSEIKGTGTDIAFEGSMPIAAMGGTGAMSATLEGTVNLGLAQLFDPDIRSSGELKLNVHAGSGSTMGGEVQIVDAAFSSGDLPVGLQHGNGTLAVTADRITITKFQGTVGGGQLTAQGGATFSPSVRFDVGAAAQGIRVLYPQGMRESIDANIRLDGSMDSARLSGSVNLSDISFTSAFDLNSFIGQLGGGVPLPPTPGFGQNLQLNLSVRSTNDINLVSRTLSVGGSANLQVRGTAATPVILGRVNLNNGDIILNGDRFLLNGGTVQFVNASETEPVVNLTLKTTIQQYDIYLRFNGPVDQLRTNYSSDPALPSADIINLLAFGQTTEASAANSASTNTNQQAESLVASQVSSEVTSRVSRIAGISQLSISPVLTSGTSAGPPGANITVQQRVTGNLFVTFSSNVASTQNTTIQGQYQLSPRVALSVTRDQNGGFAFDTLIKKSW